MQELLLEQLHTMFSICDCDHFAPQRIPQKGKRGMYAVPFVIRSINALEQTGKGGGGGGGRYSTRSP